MKLYIPDIGDKITLSKDWSFNLFPEQRNIDLGAFFNHYYIYGYPLGKWVDNNVVPMLREPDYNVQYPTQPQIKFYGAETIFTNWRKECKEAENNCPEFVQYEKDKRTWEQETRKHGKKDLTVTIPAGTVLTVDRIYIRKGMKDYSSVSFFADLGETNVYRQSSWSGHKKTKKKALRFWAKLEDCNNIEL